MSEIKEVFVLKLVKNENRGKYLERCSKNNRMRLQHPNMRERLNACMHGFNSFYKYWNKMEDFAGVPEDSALGECIATEKAKGADYRTAYAVCSTKVVSPSTPVVLSEDDNNLIEEPVLLADYPWDECIADQLDKGYDEESATKICGYIKAQNMGGPGSGRVKEIPESALDDKEREKVLKIHKDIKKLYPKYKPRKTGDKKLDDMLKNA